MTEELELGCFADPGMVEDVEVGDFGPQWPLVFGEGVEEEGGNGPTKVECLTRSRDIWSFGFPLTPISRYYCISITC